MLVCTSWRKTIIETPRFWTRFELPYHRPLHLARNLRRAQDAPLDVAVRIRSDVPVDIESVKRFLTNNIHRVERLIVIAYGVNLTDMIADTAAPLLRRLLIRAGKRQGIVTSHLDFALSSPYLEEMSLIGCVVQPPLNVFRNVRRLHLMSASFQRKFGGWSTDSVFQVLSHCRQTVEELELDTVDIDGEQAYESMTILTLSKLRRLSWRTTAARLNLLEFISAPALQTLHTFNYSEMPMDGSRFIPSSLTQLPAKMPVVLEVYYLSTEHKLGLNFYADLSRKEKLFASTYTFLRHGWDYIEFFQAFLKEQGLPSVKHVRYSADDPGVLSSMRSVVYSIPSVKHSQVWDLHDG